jgi:hypothetical protein
LDAHFSVNLTLKKSKTAPHTGEKRDPTAQAERGIQVMSTAPEPVNAAGIGAAQGQSQFGALATQRPHYLSFNHFVAARHPSKKGITASNLDGKYFYYFVLTPDVIIEPDA